MAVEVATKIYDEEVANAKRTYEASLKRAGSKLLTAYEVAIAAAMKRGGGEALDLANKLNDEKKLKAVLLESGRPEDAASRKSVEILGDWIVKAKQDDQKFSFISGPMQNTVFRVYVGPDFPQGIKQGPYVMKRISPSVIEVDFSDAKYVERFTFLNPDTFLCEDFSQTGVLLYAGVGRRASMSVKRD
jgi:hypothetical protein